MGQIFKNWFRSGDSEFYDKKNDLGVLNQLIEFKYTESELLYTQLNAFEQAKVLNIYKIETYKYDRNIFLNDFHSYVNNSFLNINKDILNDFYELYRNQDWINPDEFIWSLNQYLHTRGVLEFSPELIFGKEVISFDSSHVDIYLRAKLIFRLLKSLILSKAARYCLIFHELPLRYICHMYSDLVSALKKANDNNYKNDIQMIISNNFFKMIQNGQKIRYRNVAFLN